MAVRLDILFHIIKVPLKRATANKKIVALDIVTVCLCKCVEISLHIL